MSDTEDKPSRVQTLTDKGIDLFYSILESYVEDIGKSWKEYKELSDLLVNLKEIAMCSEKGVLVHQTITPFCREILCCSIFMVIFRESANNIDEVFILFGV